MRTTLVAVAAGALLLSGCAGPASGYPAATAERLQNQVLAVSEAASEGKLETALSRLDELADSAQDALAQGTVTTARHESIVSAIELVRADLEALLEQESDDGEDEDEPAEEPAVDAGTGGDDSGNSGSGSENSGSGNSGDGNSGEDESEDSGGSDEEPTDEETEEPAEEEPSDEETEEPVEEEPEPEPEPTATPRPTQPPATSKPTSPPANG